MTYGEQMKKILDKFNIDTSTLPDNLYSTLLEAIYNADVAQDVVWVDNVKGTLESIEEGNYVYYPKLSVFIKEINIPNGITIIGSNAFNGCTSLTRITIPDSVTYIYSGAFSNCSSLTSITIPDSVTSIGTSAFSGCSKLTSIIIPSSMRSIDRDAFYYCTNLANIYYKGTEEQWNAITKVTGWNTNMGSNVTGGTVIHYNYTG